MEIREIKKGELDFLWNFEKENRKFDEEVLGDKFSPFYISEINEKEKKSWSDELKKSFKKSDVKIFVAEEKNKIVGYIWTNTHFLEYLNPKKKVGYVNEMFVTKKFRGKGISTKLMVKSMEWFKSQDIEYVSLCVFTGNKDAVEIYKKFGFELFSGYMRKKI